LRQPSGWGGGRRGHGGWRVWGLPASVRWSCEDVLGLFSHIQEGLNDACLKVLVNDEVEGGRMYGLLPSRAASWMAYLDRASGSIVDALAGV
jgi:hypothetical protein